MHNTHIDVSQDPHYAAHREGKGMGGSALNQHRQPGCEPVVLWPWYSNTVLTVGRNPSNDLKCTADILRGKRPVRTAKGMRA